MPVTETADASRQDQTEVMNFLTAIANGDLGKRRNELAATNSPQFSRLREIEMELYQVFYGNTGDGELTAKQAALMEEGLTILSPSSPDASKSMGTRIKQTIGDGMRSIRSFLGDCMEIAKC